MSVDSVKIDRSFIARIRDSLSPDVSSSVLGDV
jgi:hypothetical protein